MAVSTAGPATLPAAVTKPAFLKEHPKLVSPSLRVYRHFGFRSTEALPSLETAKPTGGQIAVDASSGRESLPQMIDGLKRTRWAASRAEQRGDEWVRIDFAAPLTLGGIVMDTGRYPTDFPRGVRITAGNHCEEPALGGDFKNILFEQKSWQGPLRFTEAGYPHFGGEHEVEIRFEHEAPVGCLLIEQIGKNGHFDWSIAEIRLLVPGGEMNRAAGGSGAPPLLRALLLSQ